MIVACVRTGQKYGPEYVFHLRDGVKRHLRQEHRFVCFTDYPNEVPGIETLPSRGFPGWWAKMLLFEPSWRSGEKVLYLDLDSVLLRDISPLAKVESPFAIGANFTLINQQKISIQGGPRPSFPCKYGSMCMVIGPRLNGHVWDRYIADRQNLEARAGAYGDQMALEWIEPHADLLQPLLPEGFFLGYRDLPEHPHHPPSGAAVVVFAGKNKPHNTPCKWARDAWLHP